MEDHVDRRRFSVSAMEFSKAAYGNDGGELLCDVEKRFDVSFVIGMQFTTGKDHHADWPTFRDERTSKAGSNTFFDRMFYRL